ncbi:hypothetical protein BDW67DRAFT_157620, partial [Aspergillus spinulosporus]
MSSFVQLALQRSLACASTLIWKARHHTELPLPAGTCIPPQVRHTVIKTHCNQPPHDDHASKSNLSNNVPSSTPLAQLQRSLPQPASPLQPNPAIPPGLQRAPCRTFVLRLAVSNIKPLGM